MLIGVVVISTAATMQHVFSLLRSKNVHTQNVYGFGTHNLWIHKRIVRDNPLLSGAQLELVLIHQSTRAPPSSVPHILL